mmetsp:Transcript_18455/g.69924  ORF Transcript_18455/g.69924 Transcript_18455/m.69924 type:complete len:206 (+) Transcript_18455:1272-1889(+)
MQQAAEQWVVERGARHRPRPAARLHPGALQHCARAVPRAGGGLEEGGRRDADHLGAQPRVRPPGHGHHSSLREGARLARVVDLPEEGRPEKVLVRSQRGGKQRQAVPTHSEREHRVAHESSVGVRHGKHRALRKLALGERASRQAKQRLVAGVHVKLNDEERGQPAVALDPCSPLLGGRGAQPGIHSHPACGLGSRHRQRQRRAE